MSKINILVTGSSGFIGKNVLSWFRTIDDLRVFTFTKDDDDALLENLIKSSDVIIHLAGENRPQNTTDFFVNNVLLTEKICSLLQKNSKKSLVIFASTAQAELNSLYGRSKLKAESLICKFSELSGAPVIIYRLPGVFGRWCRPNYNSVVATYCHNIANNIPIKINDPNTELNLVYIDDVIKIFLQAILNPPQSGVSYQSVFPEFSIRLDALANRIYSFKEDLPTLSIGSVGEGLVRALYSTYISYLPTNEFSYKIKVHQDQRGSFAEVLKTHDSGQFSFFTAKSGATRGGHYHFSKAERFIILKGNAKFRFENILTKDKFEIFVSGDAPQVVQTIPGWAHDITNVGPEELIAILWANELFDANNPDTYNYEISS
jgi:UDP-2-acetamido-2,6-beta-L-arabino-hexul-4-ose reductase